MNESSSRPTGAPRPAPSGGAEIEEALRDQQSRWRRGERILVENLIASRPDWQSPEAVLELIHNEILLREEAGDVPELAEYRQRFPLLASACRIQWEMDRLLFSRRSHVEGQPGSAGGDADTTVDNVPATPGLRYRILRAHAKGGLGEVFVAEDTELHRQVALKQIQERHAGHDASRGRFLLEAEITGGLEHPGIVPVYGLGTYRDGRPYYAMRFIKGDNLKEAIARFHQASRGARRQRPESASAPVADASPPGSPRFDSLEFRQLLGRFIGVCNAVAYAHSRGVLHRDLKPGNIMLGKFGETLVVDWGLAKVVGRGEGGGESGATVSGEDATLRPSSGSDVAETAAGAAIGTPTYMSPEQAAGKIHALGAATDVYSLGATLYTLLTNRPPVAGNGTGEILRKVQRGDVDWHSGARFQGVPGALVAICRKAMALKPAGRYATPLALVEDLEHWLADEPVSAHKEPIHVRGGRWMRKHRALVSSAAAGLLVATLGSVVAAVLLAGVNRQLDEANTNLSTTNADLEAANAKLKTINVNLELARQETERKRQEAVQEKQIALAVESFLLHDLLKQADPSEQANRVLVLGGDRFATQENPTIKELLDRAAAQLTPEQIEKKFPGQPLVHAEILHTVGRAYIGVGDFTKAIAHLKRAQALYEAKLGAEHPNTLKSMNDLAATYKLGGKLDLALPLFEQTLKLRTAKLGAEHPSTLASMNNLAEGYRAAGKLELALPLFEEMLKLCKATLGPDHPSTLTTMNNLAGCYQAVGKLDLAVPLFEQTLKLRTAKLGPDHPDTLASMNNLAMGYEAAGKLDLPLLEETLQLSKAKLGPEHPLTLASMNSLAVGYQAAGQLDKALPLLEETLQLSKAKLGADHPDTLRCMNNLATSYQAVGKLNKALPLFEESLKLRKAKLGPDHPLTLTSMNNLAAGYRAAGKLDLALPLLEETLQLSKAKLGPEHPSTLNTMANLAVGYLEVGKLHLALPLLEETVKLRRAKLGPDHPSTLTTMNNLAMSYKAAGKLDLAVLLLEETLKLSKAKLGSEHPTTLSTMNNLAGAYQAAGKRDLALALFEETLKLRKAKLGPDHPSTLATMAGLGVNYRDAGRLMEAIPLLEEAYEKGRRHASLQWVSAVLLDAYIRAGKKSEGSALVAKELQQARKVLPKDSPQLGNVLAGNALALLQLQAYPEAEPLLRECLAIREKTAPDDWSTFNTQSMLGGALLGQKQYADAEPLLLAGYYGMKRREAKIPTQAKMRLTEAEGRLAELFEATRKKDESKLEGKLTDAKTEVIHEVKLTAGKVVVVEMRSKQFNTYLRLEDAKGKLLAENDDIDPAANNLNSRIWFMPKADGVYRIVATSFRQQGRGDYEIVVWEYSAEKSK